MQYKIEPMRVLRGEIIAPPSKSHSHRAFILALGASSPTFLVNPLVEGDVAVTRQFCFACGATIEELHPDSPEYVPFSPSSKVYKIHPPSRSHKIPVLHIDGANSGTSIRFCTVLAPFFAEETFISGTFFERHRPMDPLFEAIKPMGITVDHTDSPLGIHIHGSPRTPPLITLPGDISSQFISSLLLAIPHLPQTSDQTLTTVELTTQSVSTGYLTLTEELLQAFQIQFSQEKTTEGNRRYHIPVSQHYQGQIITIPGDYSSMAPLITAAALNPFPDEIRIRGLAHPSSHPDAALLSILHQMRADWSIDEETHALVVRGGRELLGCTIDCQDIPDLFPILCVLGLFCSNYTRITHINRVEQKESSRVSIMLRELRKMGAIILRSTDGDEIMIEGPQQIRGADLNHENDHRIAMALTIAALYARNTSTMVHPLIVRDSYPNFFLDLRQIGVIYSEIDKKVEK